MYRTVNNIEHVRRCVESVSLVINADCQSSEESVNHDCYLPNQKSVENCVGAMNAHISSALGHLVSEVSSHEAQVNFLYNGVLFEGEFSFE